MDKQHEYNNVPAHDLQDDDSSTEVESLAGMEKHWDPETFKSRTRRSKRSTIVSWMKASRWWVVIGLQVVIVGLLAKDQGLLRQVGFGYGRSTSQHEVGGDMTGWGPHSSSYLEQILK
jgi:hypothetical protein